jgi:hypothetical protein
MSTTPKTTTTTRRAVLASLPITAATLTPAAAAALSGLATGTAAVETGRVTELYGKFLQAIAERKVHRSQEPAEPRTDEGRLSQEYWAWERADDVALNKCSEATEAIMREPAASWAEVLLKFRAVIWNEGAREPLETIDNWIPEDWYEGNMKMKALTLLRDDVRRLAS